MERARVRTRQLPPLQRGCERSRLEEQLVATAYELAVPIRRQALSRRRRAWAGDARGAGASATKGGLSA
jgi:hypothetical protein